MKYIILIPVLLTAFSVSAQNINPVYEINRYTVPGKESVTEAKTSTLHTKAEAAALACKCKVPFRTQGYYDGSVVKVSSSASSSSVAASSSSVSQSSSSSIARITATWKCTLQREDGTAMTESEIGGYYLKVGDEEPKNLKHTGCEMAQIIDKPAAGVVVQVAEYDTDNTVSEYAVLE